MRLTDDFLRAYWQRPEVRPAEESCERERRLHAALLEDPRRPVAEREIAAFADDAARHNYRVLLRFRQRLLDADTLEGCYATLFRGDGVDVPPLFVDQLAQTILRHLLDGCEDALQLRAAELFFRGQTASFSEGHVLLADQETVAMHASGARFGSIGMLIVESQGALGRVDLDVLDTANASLYWERDSRHDTVVSFSHGRAALTAYCRVMEAWIRHFSGAAVVIEPLRQIEEAKWAWHIGLDAESTRILNRLRAEDDVGAEEMRRILALFRMDFADPGAMRRDIAGRSVYLALSANEDDVVRMKPQNLLVNLPLAMAA